MEEAKRQLSEETTISIDEECAVEDGRVLLQYGQPPVISQMRLLATEALALQPWLEQNRARLERLAQAEREAEKE
ncbi:MAG: hypothetical protein J2P36_29025 [Ktedonobacteraceae bacterium]|nr:hypothetical protein [Ktedonobacteraceae bacterium]